MSNPNNNTLSNSSSLRDRIESKVNSDVTTGLSIGAGGAMNFQNVTDIMEFAKLMSISTVAVPKHLREQPGACLAIVIQASEWQMSPYAVANKSYSVNDRMAYESQLVAAVILRRAPIKGRIKYHYEGEGDKRKCTVTVQLLDGEVVEHQSPLFGLIQPKNSPLWKADPDQQLGYHTVRAMCRRHFPDVLLGVYTMDEMQDAPMEPRVTTGRVVPNDQGPAPRLQNPYADQAPAAFADLPETAPEPEAEPEPAQNSEPAFESPTEVSEETERKELLADIRQLLAEEDTTITKFAPLARKAGLLPDKVQIIDCDINALREIHENRRSILIGEYQPQA